ncbi:MAG: VTT domain-containing protein [Bifidobacterium thermophilum]|uniref:DedA family protein n=1 Tax=Bifidobacterium thermophilum TaxID=33905 RepID=A0A7X9RN89_9BIFI|nr:VTT domain-containing protein [Bifidobacterium thermophilum]NME62685.1 DedA family protein [Bifidobacterium thermophilum]
MGFIDFLIRLLKDPRAAIASWIAMGVAPTLGFIFLIVFIETGVVFFPFLPGDSLLFAAGCFAAADATTGKAALPLNMLLPVVWAAPVIGDQCNYFIGHFFGRRIIESGKVKAMTPERLARTEGMIDKWGPLAVFLGRFFPFIRTFMPFISGISGMKWRRFTPFSVLGGLTWSTLFTLLGYFFGGIPFVQNNFELVIVAILLISLTPTFVGLIKAKTGKRRGRGRDAEPARHAAADAGIGAAAGAGAGAEMLSNDLSGADVLSAETIAAATVKDAVDLTEVTPQD